MRVLYYYCFLFYTKVIPDKEPHATTVFVLSLVESFFVFGIVQIWSANVYCTSFGKWEGIGIFAAIAFINYLVFFRSGKGKSIAEEERPKFFGNNIFSIIVTAIFFALCVSYMFWGSTYIRNVLADCR